MTTPYYGKVPTAPPRYDQVSTPLISSDSESDDKEQQLTPATTNNNTRVYLFLCVLILLVSVVLLLTIWHVNVQVNERIDHVIRRMARRHRHGDEE
jgi:hypothetical protein